MDLPAPHAGVSQASSLQLSFCAHAHEGQTGSLQLSFCLAKLLREVLEQTQISTGALLPGTCRYMTGCARCVCSAAAAAMSVQVSMVRLSCSALFMHSR